MPNQAVYKSTAAEFLDDFLSGASEGLDATFGYTLGLLESDSQGQLSQTTQVLVHDNKLPERSTQDFEAYWLSDTSQLAGKDVGRVMRHGYAEAIRIAARATRRAGANRDALGHRGQRRLRASYLRGPGTRNGVAVHPARPRVRFQAGEQEELGGSGRQLAGSGETLDPADPPIIKVQVSGRPDAS